MLDCCSTRTTLLNRRRSVNCAWNEARRAFKWQWQRSCSRYNRVNTTHSKRRCDAMRCDATRRDSMWPGNICMCACVACRRGISRAKWRLTAYMRVGIGRSVGRLVGWSVGWPPVRGLCLSYGLNSNREHFGRATRRVGQSRSASRRDNAYVWAGDGV